MWSDPRAPYRDEEEGGSLDDSVEDLCGFSDMALDDTDSTSVEEDND